MMKRLNCVLLTVTLLPLCAFAATDRPNILLIVAEDLSPRIGAFGDPLAKTPSIDGLARSGTRYTQVFTAAGVCAPSRSALITGVYPQSMGTHQMRTSNMNYEAVPPPEVKAFPELLRRAGYATANAVKTDYQFGEPFTVWDANVGGYDAPADYALWRHLPEDQPFFAMITLMDTHESRLVDESTEGAGRWKPFVDGLKKFRAANIAPVTAPEDVIVPPYYPDTPAVRRSIAQHYDNIHYMDGQVGQILANLEADGLGESTIVIWTTDHGDGLPRAKRSIYDSGLLVPMVVRWPDGRGAEEIDRRLVSFVDLAPTILKLAGAEVPGFIQGQDFLNDAPREHIFAARDRMDLVPDRVRAARDGRFKYIRNYMPDLAYFRALTFRDMFPVMKALWAGHEAGTLRPVQARNFSAPRAAEELYDTVADPHEVHNLAADAAYAKELLGLRSALDEWLTRVGDLAEAPETDMVENMWPGGAQPTTAPPVARPLEGTEQVALESATPGASIGYRVEGGRWLLYTGPLDVQGNEMIETKAIRYGYAESEVVHVGVEPADKEEI